MGVLQICYGARVKIGTLYMICGKIAIRKSCCLIEWSVLISTEKGGFGDEFCLDGGNSFFENVLPNGRTVEKGVEVCQSRD